MGFLVEVEGCVFPAELAGNQALEFCNTWAGWNGGESGDFLKTYDHLAVWTGWQGLLSERAVAAVRRQASVDRELKHRELERAREFRASLYRVLTSGPTGAAWRRVAAEIERSAERSHLVTRVEPEGPIASWTVEGRADLDAPLLAIAAVVGELLTSPSVRYVRSCPGVGCGWLFLDPSGRRIWCTMAICGNRAKARRFAERRARRADGSPSSGATSRTRRRRDSNTRGAD
jgi:predicted RNA-binding Zn ribbon-like protein